MSEIKKKVCCNCKLTQTYDDFYKDKRNPDGLYSWCKKCIRKDRENKKEYKKAYDKQYICKNRDFIYKRNKEYQARNKNKLLPKKRINCQRYRARKKKVDANYTEKQWIECKDFFGNKCAYCGKERKLEQDHFIPVSKGGEYTKYNIVPSCRSCNASKKNSDFIEWYKTNDFYSVYRKQNIFKYLNYNKNMEQQLTLFIYEVVC